MEESVCRLGSGIWWSGGAFCISDSILTRYWWELNCLLVILHDKIERIFQRSASGSMHFKLCFFFTTFVLWKKRYVLWLDELVLHVGSPQRSPQFLIHSSEIQKALKRMGCSTQMTAMPSLNYLRSLLVSVPFLRYIYIYITNWLYPDSAKSLRAHPSKISKLWKKQKTKHSGPKDFRQESADCY